MGKGSSENPRDDWKIGTGVLGTWATPGPAAGLWLSQYCPSPPRPQLQAAGEALASDQTLHARLPPVYMETPNMFEGSPEPHADAIGLL